MAKRSLVEELDRAVEGIIGNPEAALPEVDSRIAPLIRIAADLLDLPAAEFQARLKNELLGSKVAAGQSAPDVRAELVPEDVWAALDGLPEMTMRFLASLDQCKVGVSRSSDQTPLWERHVDGEELLHVLEGALDVTTLTAEGRVNTLVPAGSIFVCPRGLWHWPRPQPTASLLFVTPGKGTERSRAKDRRLEVRPIEKKAGVRTADGSRRKPRLESRQAGAEVAPAAEVGPAAELMIARDIRAALSGVPLLAISESTTGEEAGAAFPQLGSLNQCGLYAGRFSGLSPWERHTTADELLHVLEGEVEITTLTDAGPVRNTLRAGSVFVCPRGLWHRQYSAGGALSFSATPQPTDVSFADDPRDLVG